MSCFLPSSCRVTLAVEEREHNDVVTSSSATSKQIGFLSSMYTDDNSETPLRHVVIEIPMWLSD